MPSDERLQLILEALQGPTQSFRSTLATTADEVRGYLATSQSNVEGHVARITAELGPFARGRIDAERFTALFGNHRPADPIAVDAIEHALRTLTELAARGDSLLRVSVPESGNLHGAVAQALGEIGRAFEAARVVHEVRAGLRGSSRPDRASDTLPFSRWTRSERRLAPPLVVTIHGGDLRAAGLSEFLDGRQKIVLVVEGECTPAPLVRLVAPGTFVLQTHDGAGLDRFAGWDGPGAAALVPESAARFVHDPGQGAATWERLTVHFVPDTVSRKTVGGLSAAQQREELQLVRDLATRPAGAEPHAAGAVAAAVPAAVSAPSEPADKLAAWLLSQADLSDLG